MLLVNPTTPRRVPYREQFFRNNQGRVGSLTAASLGNYDWREPLGRLRVRTLVIHGDADPIPLDSAREWAASIPDARFLLIENCGHFPQIEQPEALFAAVDEFLSGRWPAGAHTVTGVPAGTSR